MVKKRAAAEINSEEPIVDIADLTKPASKGTTTASIHKSQPMIRKIESKGYHVMYLPPYSPELNPIEQFWAKVKGKMKKIYCLELLTHVMKFSSVIFMASLAIPNVK
ncbi:hypothetical protein [Parasitella parasitica]|uniref:Tc1-like transposase DDE domain-containing protein n=1 Tax=Parasitella parasitica TaxID=35722 RepID=A0A0B7NMG0_9FUNG|nr:hypothetical protein [Parasitella parasitica]